MSKTAISEVPICQRRKKARPAGIMAAALDMFVERGFAATKMDDVAAHAGISKGTLCLYFVSKEELFKAVIQLDILPVLEQVEEMSAQHSGDTASLLAACVKETERPALTIVAGDEAVDHSNVLERKCISNQTSISNIDTAVRPHD